MERHVEAQSTPVTKTTEKSSPKQFTDSDCAAEVETSEIEPDRERILERGRRHHREVSETPELRASENAREERLPPEPKADQSVLTKQQMSEPHPLQRGHIAGHNRRTTTESDAL
ncbi:unnamed protein product [Brassica napus]|uniref:(rape) hypothetical protein n=1 Tax=Brassica napus TaxID=3708 RepID=A0A816IX86_BRANA|nr:unnamed protein product [Brassica napus]